MTGNKTDMYGLRRKGYMADLLYFKNNTKRKSQFVNRSIPGRARDSFTISTEAKGIQKASRVYEQTGNLKFDQTVDIQSYFDKAVRENQNNIENPKAEITRSCMGYVSDAEVYRQILTDKYKSLVDVAKQQADPQEYINQKYFYPSCEWFAADLTDRERRIAYQNEMSMLTKGTTDGVNFEDSFFRVNNITVTYEEVSASEISYRRQLLNAEVKEIFRKNDIQVDDDAAYTIEVDPYSYYITVVSRDARLKQKMEKALNVDQNGKNLWEQIYYFSTRDNAGSTQISNKKGNSEGYAKYQKYLAYQDTYHWTGYKLDELREADATYYTEDGKDIMELIREAVWKDADVPRECKADQVRFVCDRVREVSEKGWANIPDAILAIEYTVSGFRDLYQKVSFEVGSQYISERINSGQSRVLATY